MLGVAGILTMENVLSMKITKLLGYITTLYQDYGLIVYIVIQSVYRASRKRVHYGMSAHRPLGAQFPAKV